MSSAKILSSLIDLHDGVQAKADFLKGVITHIRELATDLRSARDMHSAAQEAWAEERRRLRGEMPR